jgi:hypothetical protein
MNNWYIERYLSAVQQRWKWLVFGRRLGTVGLVLCAVWFFVELTGREHILTHTSAYHLLAVLTVITAFLSLLVIFMMTFAVREKRAWVANALEKSCPPLMDRVNTLIYFEENPRLLKFYKLKSKIEDQATAVVQTARHNPAFSSAVTLRRLGLFLLALAGVLLFQKYFDPFGGLLTDSVAPSKKDAPFQLAPQKDVAEAQPKKVFGEVRIVDPGHDVRLTKVDVLPLQIEMTTSENMEKPAWVTSINGGAETVNNLPAPTDPNYMVYQPLIYLDQLNVSEWDVVAYYAKVKSAAPADYTSPISFIEIRPFREDILKQSGGGKGKKRYDLLSELTGLIKQQTDLIQQTHQHQAMSYPTDDMRLQDAKKLSAGENDLSIATDHYYAPVGDILDQLSQAEQEMNRATPALQDDSSAEGMQHEQASLTHLIASRKNFQKVLNEHPDAFPNDSDPTAEPMPPVASTESMKKKLSEVSEMRDRDQAAINSLHQMTAQQQALAQAKGQSTESSLKQQMQLKSDLHDLMGNNPNLFQGSEPQQAAAQQNMMQSIMKLSSGDKPGAKIAMDQAASSMKDLEKAVAQNHEAQQMADAYKLKKIIDQNAQQLGQEAGKPGSLSDQQAKDLADAAQKATNTLKDIVDNDKQGSFGPKLGQSLSAQNQQALSGALGQMAGSQPGAGRSSAAGTAQKDMQGISQAFDQSQPQLSQQIQGQDQLQPAPGDSLSQAEQDLQSMLLGSMGPGNGKPPPGDQDKALKQAVTELHEGMAEPGKTGGIIHDQVLNDADDLLKKKTPGMPVDAAALKKLIDEIEAARAEANDPAQLKPPDLNTTQVDPSKFPPAYRERLRTYFEQLSQQQAQ